QPWPRGILCANAYVSRATLVDDDRNVDKRFNVIDDGRLAEEARLRGKRRFVARFATMSLNGIEQCRLFTADVSPGATAQFDIETQAAAQNVLAEETFPSCSFNGCGKTLRCKRVFAAQINEAALRAGCESGNRHTFQHGE